MQHLLLALELQQGNSQALMDGLKILSDMIKELELLKSW